MENETKKYIDSKFTELAKRQKTGEVKIIEAIKRVNSAVIKSKFDKSYLKSILAAIADVNYKVSTEIPDLKKSLTQMIVIKNEEQLNKFNNQVSAIKEMMENLNEQIRIKLKYFLDNINK